MSLKQVGGRFGDKITEGNIPNMRIGEFRYYPQDNPSLERQPRDWITRKSFVRIMKKYFPEHILDPDLDYTSEIELKYYVGGDRS